jgi:molecular chaperone DnaJ
MVKPCLQCKGKGKIQSQHTVTFQIPPGVKTGTRLKLGGKGNPGLNGGRPGDLYVVINVDAHPFFEREENDIIYHLPLSFCQMSLGAKVKVPTLEGKKEVRVPPGTQSGEVLRLKQKGIPFAQGTQRGDQKVIVEVIIPSKLTLKQKKLLRQFEKLS